MTRPQIDRELVIGAAVGIVATPLLTLALDRLPAADARAYVFLYLGIVVSLGLLAGLIPALIAAALSSVLADYFFLPPINSLSLANPGDVIYLIIFFATAGGVGGGGGPPRDSTIAAGALLPR